MKRILGVVVALAMVASVLGAGFSALAGGAGSPPLVELPGGFWVSEYNQKMLFVYTGDAKDVVIPNEITEIYSMSDVDAIKQYNYNATATLDITSVSIHSGVTIIVQGPAFRENSSLKQINVSSNNANYSSVDGVLFNKDKTELLRYPAGKTASTYSIPSSVTAIKYGGAFFGCTSLVSMNIPSNITSIERSTFEGCTSLKSVNIPSGVTSIYDNAFAGCTSLKSLYIPDSVTYINTYAFSGYVLEKTITLIVNRDSYAHKWAVEREHPYTLFFVSEIADMKDIFDVMTLAVSGLELSAEQIAVADLNGDGKVDAVDTLAALKIILGL